MKAIVKTNYPILKGIFDKGDKVEIEPVFSTHREVLSHRKVEYEKQGIKGFKWVEDMVREAGEYIGYKIKSKNGHYYDDQCFLNAIGYKDLSQIFEKA